MTRCHWTVDTDFNMKSKCDKAWFRISYEGHVSSQGMILVKTSRVKISTQKRQSLKLVILDKQDNSCFGENTLLVAECQGGFSLPCLHTSLPDAGPSLVIG